MALERGFAAAFWAAMVGGVILLVGYFATLPAPLALLGLMLFVGSTAGAFALAVVASRREGIGVVRSLRDGLRTAMGWIIAFLPP